MDEGVDLLGIDGTIRRVCLRGKVFAIGLMVIPCVGGTIAFGVPYFPSGEVWETVSSEEAGVDSLQFEHTLDLAGAKNSKGVVALWNGRILAERYWDGWTEATTHPAYSATKSLVSTLVGMAIEEGAILGTDQSASVFLEEWQGDPAHETITIGHLLSMTSGLQGGEQVFFWGNLVQDERAFATSLPVEHAPGTRWDYHNSAYRLLFSVLEEATGESLSSYTDRKLLDPLGMEHTSWSTKLLATDQYTFLNTTARDLARYGLFVSADGNWDEKQLVGGEWIEQATSPANTDVNPSYGDLWWLNGGDFYYLPLVDEPTQGPIFPGCPDDAFAALGKDDQKLYIVPSLDLVVARLGEAADSSGPTVSTFDAEFFGEICQSFGGGLDCNGDGAVNLNDLDCISAEQFDAALTQSGLILADANGDGEVSLLDFNILKANFGVEGHYTDGDFDKSGVVGLNDFVILKENFGNSNAIPEPSGWCLVVIGAIAGAAASAIRRGLPAG